MNKKKKEEKNETKPKINLNETVQFWSLENSINKNIINNNYDKFEKRIKIIIV
jgi:hypothetical protein